MSMAENNDAGAALVPQILQVSADIFQALGLSIPPEWLSSDMTVAQLRILLLLHTDGASRMSSIAAKLGIAVSTGTGTIDNLVKKGLVERSADPEDRRVVTCYLSLPGQEIINSIWSQGQSQMEFLLRGLTVEQLQKAKEVADFLLTNVQSKLKDNSGKNK